MKIGTYYQSVYNKNDVHVDVYDELPKRWEITGETSEPGTVLISNGNERALLITYMKEFLYCMNGNYVEDKDYKDPYDCLNLLDSGTVSAIQNLKSALEYEFKGYSEDVKTKAYVLRVILRDIIEDHLM